MSFATEISVPVGPDPAGIPTTGPLVSDSGYGAEPGPFLLLLEDDEALRQMLAWELDELGYRVFAVGDCRAAREAVAARNFDLALFDIELPDGDGAELAGELTEQSSAPRIVLCSGRPGNPIPERLDSRILAFVSKPVSIQRLDELFRGRD